MLLDAMGFLGLVVSNSLGSMRRLYSSETGLAGGSSSRRWIAYVTESRLIHRAFPHLQNESIS